MAAVARATVRDAVIENLTNQNREFRNAVVERIVSVIHTLFHPVLCKFMEIYSNLWCGMKYYVSRTMMQIYVLSGFAAGKAHVTETPGGTRTRIGATGGRATGWYRLTTTTVWPEAQSGRHNRMAVTITMPWPVSCVCQIFLHGKPSLFWQCCM